MRCDSNMKLIGMGISMYADDYKRLGSLLPPDLQTLLATEQLTADVFTCPSSSDTKATGPTTQAVLSDLAKPGHCSYIYVGAGLTVSCNPNCVLLLEDPINHGLAGAHILYADGHVEWQTLDVVISYLNDLAGGRNPPSKPSMTLQQATASYNRYWKSLMPQLKTGACNIASAQAATLPVE